MGELAVTFLSSQCKIILQTRPTVRLAERNAEIYRGQDRSRSILFTDKEKRRERKKKERNRKIEIDRGI